MLVILFLPEGVLGYLHSRFKRLAAASPAGAK